MKSGATESSYRKSRWKLTLTFVTVLWGSRTFIYWKEGYYRPCFWESEASFRMTLKKHVCNRQNIRLKSNKSTRTTMYIKVLGSVLINNCVCGTGYCRYQFCHCFFWISTGRLKHGLCVFSHMLCEKKSSVLYGREQQSVSFILYMSVYTWALLV